MIHSSDMQSDMRISVNLPDRKGDITSAGAHNAPSCVDVHMLVAVISIICYITFVS